MPAEQLTHLLIAWRALRHPRIAELIDRVSARALEGQKPIKGKSVPDRVKLIQAACETKDPVEVARVLASEWPGTWQTALPMLEALLKLPDDPRVAKELARQVDLTRYDTWTSESFYRPLFSKLNALGDVRQLPLLEAQLARTKTHYYQRDMRPLEERAVAHHRTLKVPELTAEHVELLETLEAPYAGAAAREKTSKRSGAELLEAVYANPEDPGARAVYGDWLTEHGDPRGELISLQLAPPSDKSTRRQQALIKKHWKQWLGPLADWFRDAPRFEAGFPVSGQVDNPSYSMPKDAFLTLLNHREWCTIRSLGRWWSSTQELVATVKHPNLKALRELKLVSPDALPALAEVGGQLTSLDLTANIAPDFDPGSLEGLSKLERVELQSRVLARVGHRLGPLNELSLVLDSDEDVPAMWTRVEKMPVREVQLRKYYSWARLERGGRSVGPFTTAHLMGSVYLNELLAVLPTTLTAIVSDGVEKAAVPKQALEKLEPLFARFPKLQRKELPFVEELERPKVPHVSVSMTGVAFFQEPMIAPLMKVLTDDFGVPFDSFDARGDLDLGDDPVAKLTTWVNNKRCRGVRIKVRGTEGEFSLYREPTYFTNATLPLGEPRRFFKALEALLAFAKPRYLRVARDQQMVTIEDMTGYAAQREALRALLTAPP